MSHPVIGVPPKNADTANPMHGQISLAAARVVPRSKELSNEGRMRVLLPQYYEREGTLCFSLLLQ